MLRLSSFGREVDHGSSRRGIARWNSMGQDDEENHSLSHPECGFECPLRKASVLEPDPALVPAIELSSSTRGNACSQIYTTLRPWQTRLLQVHPGQLNDPILVELIIVDLIHISGAVSHETQQRVQFNALSYTWGDAIFPRSLTLAGLDFPITENLYSFLQRYRDSLNTSFLWVDALCINQSDLDEKAVHVSNILAIFERARQVYIWLGEEGRHTKLAIKYLSWANDKQLQAGSGRAKTESHAEECRKAVSWAISGIKDLCTRPWVRRIWIKQEVWAAKKLLVCCGTTRLTWDEYIHGPSIINRLTKYLELHDATKDGQSSQTQANLPVQDVLCLEHLRNKYELARLHDSFNDNEQFVHDILRLLNESTNCQTTNAHDRIYALLGIAGVESPEAEPDQQRNTLTLTVDYTIPLQLLYRRLAMSIILHAGAYAILATDGSFGDHGGLKLPSWVPDFRRSTRCHLMSGFRLAPSTTQPIHYSLADEARLQQLRQLNKDSSSSTLLLEGYHIATIEGPKTLPPRWEVYPAIHSRPRDRGKHAPIEDYPFLTAMEVVHGAVLYDKAELEDLPRYLLEYSAFAVSPNARPGDIVALAETVGIPVVLRPIEHTSGHFEFISCAWLFSDLASPLAGCGRGSRPLKPWNPWRTLRQELRECSPGSGMLCGEKELFQIE